MPLIAVTFLKTLPIALLSFPKPPERPTTNPVRAISNDQNGCAATNVSIVDSPASALDIRLIAPATTVVARALTLKTTHIAATAASAAVRILIAVALCVIADISTDNALSTVVRIGANALKTLMSASRAGLSKPSKAPISLITAWNKLPRLATNILIVLCNSGGNIASNTPPKPLSSNISRILNKNSPSTFKPDLI